MKRLAILILAIAGLALYLRKPDRLTVMREGQTP